MTTFEHLVEVLAGVRAELAEAQKQIRAMEYWNTRMAGEGGPEVLAEQSSKVQTLQEKSDALYAKQKELQGKVKELEDQVGAYKYIEKRYLVPKKKPKKWEKHRRMRRSRRAKLFKQYVKAITTGELAGEKSKILLTQKVD